MFRRVIVCFMPSYYLNYKNFTTFLFGEVAVCVAVQAYMRHVVPNVDGNGYKAMYK
jgi:hypothetical protein